MTDRYDQHEDPPRSVEVSRRRERSPRLSVLTDQFSSMETDADRERPLTVPDGPLEQIPGLAELSGQFAGLETDADRERPLTVPDVDEGPASDAPPARTRRKRRRIRAPRRLRRLLPAGAGAVILAIVVLVLLQPHGTSRALANPSQAAMAAEEAGTFSFITTSTLSFAGITTSESETRGKVNYAHGGAFAVRVLSKQGIGFERIVFPAVVYFRGIGAHGPRAWRAAKLSTRVKINARTPSGAGLADPLVLLGALARHHGARPAGPALVDGQHTLRYTLTLPLAALVPTSTNLRPAQRTIPVEIDVWQNHEQQLVRAVRTFRLGGPRHEQLTIQTDFADYREPNTIVPPPGVKPTGPPVPLDATANDPVGASLSGALAAGTGHGPTPLIALSRTSANTTHVP